MITIYTAGHARHDPPHEFLEGRLISYNETPSRAETILRAVHEAGLGPVVEPREWGQEPILAVHTPAYLEHLRTIYERWCVAGGPAEGALPAIIPVRGLERRSPSPFAEVGYFAFDLSAPVGPHTYEVALGSAHCALTGAALLLEGERLTYALCRPPGHHAHPALMGGFCYLNNAAIAAEHLARATGRPVALLDIDVHAGNGTQAIFYERADVLFLSIHGAPEWEYPYFAGFADEAGAGAGAGYTVNYPLEAGVDDGRYLGVLDEALARITAFGPAYLVLSAGFDTFAGDPLGKFSLSSACYPAIGARIAALGLPTLVVQEGGYTVAALGQNVVGLLRGLGGK